MMWDKIQFCWDENPTLLSTYIFHLFQTFSNKVNGIPHYFVFYAYAYMK